MLLQIRENKHYISAQARDVGAKKLFGEYANLNFQTAKGMVYGT